MNAVLDVHYGPNIARAACVAFCRWSDPAPRAVFAAQVHTVADYRPGAFYERELPCLMEVLASAAIPFRCLVVDGYVHLRPPAGKGMGRHLWERLGRRCRVIGVAKSPFPAADRFLAVHRGRSRRPLFVSAAGMATGAAASRIEGMHGPHRIPTLIRLADRIARGAPVSGEAAPVLSRPGRPRRDGAPGRRTRRGAAPPW